MLAALFAPAHAATIQAFATQVNSIDGGFSDTAGGTSALSTDEIQAIIASDASAAIFGTSTDDFSVINLGFGDTIVKTGSGGDSDGADLVVVSLWNDISYEFRLEAFNTEGSSLSLYTYTVNSSTPNARDGSGAILNDIKTTSINLYGSDYLQLEDDIEIGSISLTIGGALNGDSGLAGYSNFSLAGAYYTDPVVVPLPLPAVLFSSGLLLLGWVGRRKTI